MDVKYSLTPSLTLDATYNTDFAQVEVDTQQINLDRFNLFFPEKRPFFLENAGLFSVGIGGEAEVFFSRAIGIGADDLAIPIVGGGAAVGAHSPADEHRHHQHADGRTGTCAALPANNFSVARVQHELPNRSAVGAIFVNRQATGDLAGDRDYNRSYAVDARVGFGQNGLVNGFVARTQTPGLSGDQYAFQLGATHNTEEWRLGAGYAEVGRQLQPRGRVSGARQRIPQSGIFGEPEHPAAAGQLLEIPRAAAARRLRRVLELRRSSRNGAACTSTSTGSCGRATSFTPA